MVATHQNHHYLIQHKLPNSCEVKNPLGVVVAVLKEYIISSTKEENLNDVICRICKTKEGSWYDLEETEQPGIRLLLPHFKSAIDKAEERAVSSALSAIKKGL